MPNLITVQYSKIYRESSPEKTCTEEKNVETAITTFQKIREYGPLPVNIFMVKPDKVVEQGWFSE